MIGHLFYTHSSFMHHFIAIGEFTFKWQSENAQIGSNLTIFLPPVTMKFYRWPWKTIAHLFYTHSSFMHHFIAIGEFTFEWQSGNAQIGSNLTIFCLLWPWNFTMTLNKANLRDLIAATGLVISNWIQIVNFSSRVTVKFDGWPCKTIGHLLYTTSSFVHHFVPIGEFKLELQSGNAQCGSKSTVF